MKCIIYARTATEKQNIEGNSLEAQEKLLRDYAKKNNLEVGQVISEVASATDSNRKGYKELLEGISSGNYDCILCTDIYRLSRSTNSFLELLFRLRSMKMGLMTPTWSSINNPEVRFQESIGGAIAQYKNEKRIESIKRGVKMAKLRKQ